MLVLDAITPDVTVVVNSIGSHGRLRRTCGSDGYVRAPMTARTISEDVLEGFPALRRRDPLLREKDLFLGIGESKILI